MKKIISVLALTGLLSISALAGSTPLVMVAESPDKTVKITLVDEPCTGKVADLIGSVGPVSPNVKKATVMANGKTMEACWMASPDGVAILSEDGQEGVVGYEHFKPGEDV